jgi:hypothetical protein
MDPSTLTQQHVTHPETAWLVDLVPLAATAGLIILVVLLFRGRLRAALDVYLLRRFGGPGGEAIEDALLYHPPIITAGQLLALCLAAVLVTLAVLSRLAPMLAAVVLSGPLTAVLVWVLLWAREQAYVAALDAALPAAVGRLEAQLRSGSGIQEALTRVMGDLPASPLKAEWAWFIDRLGAPLAGRALATAPRVCAALILQTPSRRHATFLGHLEIALDQPHSALVRRMAAAYDALLAAERRRSTAVTALAQMRNSGVVLFLATLTITLYLFAVQRARFFQAYSGDLGLAIGCGFAAVIVAPLIAGHLLARVDDVDY